MHTAPSVSVQLVLVCAQWCGVCRDFRPDFDTLMRDLPGVDGRWLDTEDDEQLLAGLEPDNFPTLLIAVNRQVRFFGVVVPRTKPLRRLLTAVVSSTDFLPVNDTRLDELLKRLWPGP